MRRFKRLHAGAAALLMLFLYAPLLVGVLFAFNAGTSLSWPLDGLSLRWFDLIFSDPGFRDALAASAKVAGVTTVIATAAGVAAALAITRRRTRLVTGMEALSALPVMVPPLLIGVALLTLFGDLGVSLSLTTVIAGHLIFVLPYVVVVVVARLRRFDLRLEEAARDLGGSPPAVLGRVTFPIIMPAIAGGALLAFGLSFDEVLITNFTVGDETTLPIFVLSRLRRTIDPSINAVATVLLVIPWIALGIALLILARSFKAREDAPAPAATIGPT